MFLFRNKRCYSNNFQLFWSCYRYIFWFLEIKIWWNTIAVSISTLYLPLAENQVEKNYNKIHLSGLWKCCYTKILIFLCVQRFISLFLIALTTSFHHRFLVILFYLRLDHIGNKLKQPFRNQRQVYKVYKMSTLRPTFFIMSVWF